MSAENVDVVKGIYQAFATGDVPAVVARDEPRHRVERGRELPLFRRQSLSRPRRRSSAACSPASAASGTASRSSRGSSSTAATR